MSKGDLFVSFERDEEDMFHLRFLWKRVELRLESRKRGYRSSHPVLVSTQIVDRMDLDRNLQP